VETLAGLDAPGRDVAIDECRALTSAVCDGLDLTGEIDSLADPGTGGVVVCREDGRVAALALCHVGAASEAVTGTCYVKVAAVRPGEGGVALLDGLLGACETFASSRGAVRLEVGVNLERRAAAELLAERGHRTFRHGVAMHRPPAGDPDTTSAQLVLDDWR
jgi:hypothetical protein